MCEEPQTEQQWYAIRVTYSREMAAKSYLDSIGIESYVPMHFAERTYGGKRRKVWEPLIHNLLFIRTSADRLREIKATTTLPIRYIMDRESKSPTVIPERQMQDFMAVVATQNEHVEIVAPQDVDLEREIRYASRRAYSPESKAATSATRDTARSPWRSATSQPP